MICREDGRPIHRILRSIRLEREEKVLENKYFGREDGSRKNKRSLILSVFLGCDTYKADEALDIWIHKVSLGIARVNAIWWAALGSLFGAPIYSRDVLTQPACCISSHQAKHAQYAM